MKRIFILLLKTLLILIGCGILAFLIRFPQTEGRAANLDLISIYSDPVIIYMYIATLPFFVGLYQVIKLLGNLEKNKFYSQASIEIIRIIKYCALSFIGFMVGAVCFVFINSRTTTEDGAGPIALGTVVIIISTLITVAAGKFQKYLAINSVNAQ